MWILSSALWIGTIITIIIVIELRRRGVWSHIDEKSKVVDKVKDESEIYYYRIKNAKPKEH